MAVFLFFGKSAFEFWAVAFKTYRHFYELCACFFWGVKPYYQKVCNDHFVVLHRSGMGK